MTTTAPVPLPRLPWHRRRKDIVAIVLGVLSLVTGIVVPRIPYTVPGGYHWSAYTTDHMCRAVSQATGTTIQTPTCSQASTVMFLCGCLLVARIVLAVAGTVLTVRASGRAS